MRKLLLLLPLIALLAACQSNKEICARWAASEMTDDEAAKKLKLTGFYLEQKAKLSSYCQAL